MKNPDVSTTNRKKSGWVMVITGTVLFITGLMIRNFHPGTIADTRLIEGLGILIAGWGIVPVVRSLSARKNPGAARRTYLDEADERAISIRNQAAFPALLFSEAAASILLICYSAMTRGQPGIDLLWFALAFLVIAPMLLFAGLVNWFNRG